MRSIVDILVVEDSDDDAEHTMAALRDAAPERSTFRVIDGEQALQFTFATGGYAQRPPGLPHLILLDLKDGLRVLRALRAQDAAKEIPVVVWTSSDNPIVINKAFELGASDYRVKPLILESYRAEIGLIAQTWLREQRPTADDRATRSAHA